MTSVSRVTFPSAGKPFSGERAWRRPAYIVDIRACELFGVGKRSVLTLLLSDAAVMLVTSILLTETARRVESSFFVLSPRYSGRDGFQNGRLPNHCDCAGDDRGTH
jgi:hypothetical protein